MASILKHLRSSTADKRPTASGLAEGQIAINTASGSPGIFFKDSNSNVVKVGPVHVGAAAPNASPAGSAGNSLGELWVDNSLTTPGLNYYSGSAFVNLTPSGTTTTVGLVELATNAETQTGSDAVRAVTPAGLQSKVSDSISTTSSITIASATAVKTAYDLANAALPKSGGTVTGEILISPSGSLVFEGSSDDSFETTLAVVNPTADRTITLPNITGTVVTTGDTGSVTSTMIADGTIINADINASAAIDPSKLGSGALPSGVTVSSTNIVDGTIVDADVNPSAAIAGTKISPNFGGQNVVTTGSVTGASLIPSSSTVPTNGLYLPAANTVALSTASTGRLFIDSTGRIGVNTNAPDSLLHLSSSSPRLTFTDTDTGADHRINADSGAGNLAIDVDFNSDTASPALVANIKGSERLRITSAGLVGVGTSSPSQKLSIGNGSMFIQNSSVAAVSDLGITFALDANTQGRIYSPSGKSFAIQAGTAGSLTDALTVDQSGRVGIGTTSPTFPLDVSGSGSQTIRAVTTDTSGSSIGRLRASYTGGGGGTQSSVDLRAGDAYAYLTTEGNIPLLFGINLQERARIDSSGRLLVGTSSALSVNSVTAGVEVHSTATNNGASVSIARFNNDSSGPQLILGKSRSATVTAGTIVQNNDDLGSIHFNGDDGADLNTPAARIQAFVDGTPGDNDMPGRLVFSTTADGASSPTERLRITSAGNVGIGTSAVTNLLHIRSDSASAVDHLYIQNRNGGASSGARIAFSNGTVDYSDNRYAYIGAVNTGAAENGNSLIFATNPNGQGPNERLRITSAGNVGIGTTSPTESLEVAGNAILDANNANLKIKSGITGTTGAVNFTFNTDSSVFGSLSLPYDTRASVGLKLSADAGGYPLTLASNTSHIIFENNSTERARIDSSGRLLVGTSSAYAVASGFSGVTQQIVGSDAASFLRYSADSSAETLWFCKSRNATTGQHTVLQSNDGIARFNFQASDGTNFITAARIDAEVDGTAGANDMPGRLVFSTTADGASSPTERLRITNDGVMCYDQAAPVSYAAAATLVVGDLKNGLVQYTGAAATLTLPTGTLTEGGFSGIYTNMTFEWSVINTGSGTCTIGAGTAHTIVGGATVAAGASGRFASRRTAANTFVSYRLS